MPFPALDFRNTLIPATATQSIGLMCPVQNTGGSQGFGNFTLNDAGYFKFCTGSTAMADVTPAQAANVTLVPDQAVPRGCRCYLTRLDIAQLGATPWSNTSPTAGAVPALYVQDSAGSVAAWGPYTAFTGNSSYSIPEPNQQAPLLVGESTVVTAFGAPVATFTINAAGTAITTSASTMISTIGVGSVIRVVDGGGKGQSARITATTATVITVTPALVGVNDHASSAKDSVIAIDYQPVKTATSTTVSVLNIAGGTPYTNLIFSRGYYGTVVAGTDQGDVRAIITSTTAGGLTWSDALVANVDNTTSLINVCTNPNMNGVVDVVVGSHIGLSLNKGLVAVVNNQAGTTPLGSAVRIYGEGFFAP